MPSVRPASSGHTGGGGTPGAHWLSQRPARRLASTRWKSRLRAIMAPSTYSAMPASCPCTVASDEPGGIAARSIRSRPAPGTWTSRRRPAALPISFVNTRVTTTSASGSTSGALRSSACTKSQGRARCARIRSAKLDAKAPTNAIRRMGKSPFPACCRRLRRPSIPCEGIDDPPRGRLLRSERHLLASDGGFHHRAADRPHEHREPVHKARVRGSAGLEDDRRGVGCELESALLQKVQGRLVLEHDDLTVGLASHLETEGRLAQVGVPNDLGLLVHDPTSIAAPEDQPALGDLGKHGIAVGLSGQLIQPRVVLVHLTHHGGSPLEQHVPVSRSRRRGGATDEQARDERQRHDNMRSRAHEPPPMSFSFILRGRSNHFVLSSRAVPARPGAEGADRASTRRVRKVHVAQRLRHPAHEVNQWSIVLRMLPKCESMWARRMRVTSSSTLTGGIPANTVPVLASSASDRRRTAEAATAAPRWWSSIVSAFVQPANSLACWPFLSSRISRVKWGRLWPAAMVSMIRVADS